MSEKPELGTCDDFDSPHEYSAMTCKHWEPVASPQATRPHDEGCCLDLDHKGDCKRWMKLPPCNSAYPNFKEIHIQDDWCPKAGCAPATQCDITAAHGAAQPAAGTTPLPRAADGWPDNWPGYKLCKCGDYRCDHGGKEESCGVLGCNCKKFEPSEGTTPHIHECDHETEGEHVCRCVICGKHIGTPPSEGTTPQAERPTFEKWADTSKILRTQADRFRRDDLFPDKYFWGIVQSAWEAWQHRARAVAPVETANFVQLLPGGMCFAHGRYEGYRCPQWPKCITDPQKQEYLAQAQTLNATTFGDAGEG